MRIDLKDCEMGDIIRPEDKENRTEGKGLHPIVYIKGNDHVTFIGAMITKSKQYDDNIAMSVDHFEKRDKKGRGYMIQYNKSHLVNAKLMKYDEWKPFEKVGKLTDKGLGFVMGIIDGLEPETWDEYLKRTVHLRIKAK